MFASLERKNINSIERIHDLGNTDFKFTDKVII